MSGRFATKLNRVLLFVLLMLLCCAAAYAAPTGSICVIVENESHEAVQGINVELIAVAEWEGGNAVLKDGFADLGLSAQQLLDDPGADNAETVYQYVCAMEMESVIQDTNAVGEVRFTGLKEGVYLIFEYGDQQVAFRPFLVTIPSEIGGAKEYHVTSIPKTLETEGKTLLCIKLWDDNMNAAGARPSGVSVKLLRNGVLFRSVTLSAANNWQHKFHMLPQDGEYSVYEEPVAHYTAQYQIVPEGVVITNSYVGGGSGGGGGGGGGEPSGGEAHLAVSKVWDDNDNAAGKRPKSVTVQLIEKNTVVKTAVLNQANGWKHTFDGLDEKKNYTVKEIAVSGYSAHYSGTASTGIVIKNSYTGETDPGTPPPPSVPQPEKFDIPIRVEWIDSDNAAGKRPHSVTVRLISNGSVIATVVLDESCGWAGVFADVPADLTYSVWQDAVAEYSSTYSGNAFEGFVVTNVYTEGTTDPSTPSEPTGPETPIEPSEPETPTEPQKPSEPTIPQTGDEVLPIYALLALGLFLVLLGLVDLYRGRESYEEEN